MRDDDLISELMFALTEIARADRTCDSAAAHDGANRGVYFA
jgi:hypothetical protein